MGLEESGPGDREVVTEYRWKCERESDERSRPVYFRIVDGGSSTVLRESGGESCV